MQKLINLDLATKTLNYSWMTLNNLNNEQYTGFVLETIELREQGLTWDQCDEVLGLEVGTPNSCYALLKQQAAKAIARQVQAQKAIERSISEIC